MHSDRSSDNQGLLLLISNIDLGADHSATVLGVADELTEPWNFGGNQCPVSMSIIMSLLEPSFSSTTNRGDGQWSKLLWESIN